MKFLYLIITFITISVTANLQAQHVIPVTPVTTINNSPIQTKQTMQKTTTKKIIKQGTRLKHSKIKRICIYTGCAIGALIGTFCLVTFVLPAVAVGVVMGIASLPYILKCN